MILRASPLIGFVGGFGSLEVSQPFAPAIVANMRLPLCSALFKRHALKAGLIVARGLSVARVFAFGRRSQIAPTIIETISVYVVNLKIISGPHQKAMQSCVLNSARDLIAALRVNRSLLHAGVPIPLTNEIGVCGINYSLVTLRERDIGDIANDADGAYLHCSHGEGSFRIGEGRVLLAQHFRPVLFRTETPENQQTFAEVIEHNSVFDRLCSTPAKGD